ncbi:hypothetical protein RFI_37586 [Reticulomyxa filosa]|uniref:Kelch motif family protein n=1 Tax=Reticulomyxa filosa TaxID=46433 RepID=X6LFK9_RETFI|nr:hypothetical protein RFI_37586 [Reticulomyxa filosa]|eukprot:ETN99881.1 hypothetical protein RFI_37586 [Reticulomyxa filosa]
MSNQAFQNLKELPTPLSYSQCILHKHEFLICGGYEQRACYSYHTIKNEYKLICEYPSYVQLIGHCVVKLVDNNKDITLLSFGGYGNKHTLVMKYISVWSNISSNSSNYNEWVPFTNSQNHKIIIGRDEDNYYGVRAVIGGRNNNLLFITYKYNKISVFDLNTFQFIKHHSLPTGNSIQNHCFVSNSENGQEQEMTKTNKQNYQMLLFCWKIGMSIEYDEDKEKFQFHILPVCNDIAPFYAYAYVYVNDTILFFGGYGNRTCSKSVYKYSIREKKWITFENTLSIPLSGCVAILNEDDNYIHIIGGKDDKSAISKNEIKFINQHWIRILEIKLGWIDDFDKIIVKYSK